MLPATIGTYGGPYSDETPVDDPETQISADKANRLLEDSAQATRTVPRAIVEFKTNTSTNPPPSDVTHTSVWGSGDAQKPSVTRTGTGLYTITYATSYADGLGEAESVSFRFHDNPSVRNNTNDANTAKVKTISANAITIVVFDAASVPVPSDLGGTALVSLRLY